MINVVFINALSFVVIACFVLMKREYNCSAKKGIKINQTIVNSMLVLSICKYLSKS